MTSAAPLIPPEAPRSPSPDVSIPVLSAGKATVPDTPVAPTSGDNIRENLDFLWKVHSYTSDYIKFADTKAGVVAGTVWAVMSALVASHALDSLAQTPFTKLHTGVLFSVLALALLGCSLLFAFNAIRPRLRSEESKSLIFWNGVVKHESDMAYAFECKKMSSDEMEMSVSRHVYALAVISKRKYYWTNLAMWTGLVGVLLAGAVILLSHIFAAPSP